MSEMFSPEKYESLHGMKLGVYAIEVAKSGNLPKDCIEYVRANAGRWDGQHLEMGLFFLSKIDSLEARHEIVKYIDHPLKHIRFTVLAFLERMEQFDDFVISKVRNRVTSETDEFEKRWIERVREKSTKSVNKV